MFLDLLRRRNGKFIEAAIALHQRGLLPANTYVLDLDTIEANARVFVAEANKLGIATFAMTKQVGRNRSFCESLMSAGLKHAVAVDMACAIACKRAGMEVGNLGHLVQVPRHEANFAAESIAPLFWTVYSEQKAQEAAVASKIADREQAAMLRIHAEGDIFYTGHEGGFPASEVAKAASLVDAMDGLRFAGLTTFPALLYDDSSKTVLPTPNLTTVAKAAESLRKAGYTQVEVNAPGTTSVAVLGHLAEAGATQCEPGNGLHGTTPLHAIEDLPEEPAVLYLTEVSHLHAGRAYCFGGGLYIDPVFPDYQVRAIVSSEPTAADSALAPVDIPPPSAIDYYGMIDASGSAKPQAGDSVVFGFRGQAFVTRSNIAGVSGITKGEPKVESIGNIYGEEVAWPPQL